MILRIVMPSTIGINEAVAVWVGIAQGPVAEPVHEDVSYFPRVLRVPTRAASGIITFAIDV